MGVDYNSTTYATCVKSDFLITVDKSYQILNTYESEKSKQYLVLNDKNFLQYYHSNKFQIVENQ